jgi:hypothetical protein
MAAVVKTDEFTTRAFPMEVGVFQGDPLSVGIFLLAINPLLERQSIEKETKNGFLIGKEYRAFLATAFADDIGIYTRNPDTAQIVLNHIKQFMDWAMFEIKVPKCKCFEFQRIGSGFKQCVPALKIGATPVPAVPAGETFTFLGKEFFLSKQRLEETISETIKNVMEKIDKLRLSGIQKMRAYSFAIKWSLCWPFSLYDLSSTFLQKKDSYISTFLRKWCGVLRTSTSSIFFLSHAKLGFHLPYTQLLHRQFRDAYWKHIRESEDPEVQYRLTCLKEELKVETWRPMFLGVSVDEEEGKDVALVDEKVDDGESEEARQAREVAALEEEFDAGDEVKEEKEEKEVKQVKPVSHSKLLAKVGEDSKLKFLESKKWQGVIMTKMLNQDPAWNSIYFQLPPSLIQFGAKYILNVLPAKSILCRKLKVKVSEKCTLCGQVETIMHVLSACPQARLLGKYTWRHNSVLKRVVTFIREHLPKDWDLLVDLEDDPNFYVTLPNELTSKNLRPDIVVLYKRKKCVYMLELTVPDDENIEEAHKKKNKKYDVLLQDMTANGFHPSLLCFEVSSRGFHNGSLSFMLRSLFAQTIMKEEESKKRFLKQLGVLCREVSLCSLKCSYALWLQRNMNDFDKARELM